MIEVSTAENQVKEAIEILMIISEDSAIPRNIRKIATQSVDVLQNGELDLPVRAINAIELLEDCTGDPNCPYHARTLIWQAITRLELPLNDDDDDDEWEYYDDDEEEEE